VNPVAPSLLARVRAALAARRKSIAIVLAVAVAAVACACRDPFVGTSDAELRRGIHATMERHECAAAVELAEALIRRRSPLLDATEPAVEALLRRGELVRGAKLLLAGMKGPKAGHLGELALKQLRSGEPEEAALIGPLYAFQVEHVPDAPALRTRYASWLSREHRLDDAKEQCRQALRLDPEHTPARNLLWKIEHVYARLASAGARRSVTFTARLPAGQVAYLAGSWNDAGRQDQLRGWKRAAMTPTSRSGADVEWTATRSLEPGENWYSALVATSADPAQPATALARFPVYAIDDGAIRVDFAGHAIEPAHPLVAPRAPARTLTSRAPRTVVLCVDGETWKVLMPLVQAGLMPRTAGLIRRGTVAELRSPYPLTIPAFNLVNLGISQDSSMLDLVEGAIEVLKEQDLLAKAWGDGSIKSKDNLWKSLAEQGLSTLYTGLSEQISYDRHAQLTVHDCRVKPEAARLAGHAPVAPRDGLAAFLPATARGWQPRDAVVESLFGDALTRHCEQLELLRRTDADVALLHVIEVDASFHLFWREMEDHMYASGRAPIARYGKVIENSHRMLDVMIGEVVDQLDLTRDNLVIWSDHGACGGLVQQQLGHDAFGVGIFAGPRFAVGRVVDGQPDLSRLAPTVCAALGARAPESHAASPISEVLAAPVSVGLAGEPSTTVACVR